VTGPLEAAAAVARSGGEPATVTEALNGLDRLIVAHGDWLKSCHLRVLPTGLAETSDSRPTGCLPHDHGGVDLAAWQSLLDGPVFASSQARPVVLARLRAMVECAAALETQARRDAVLSAEIYGRFMDAVLAFLSGVRDLQSETWNLLANVDPLTGLGNRHAMFRRLSDECERYARNHQPCTLAMLDLDSFKPINDRFGHVAGDLVLRRVATTRADSVRSYDAVFRYGGDEFALCLPSTDARSAWAIVERLRTKVANLSIPVRDNVDARTSLSGGIAPLTSEAGVAAALDAADHAV